MKKKFSRKLWDVNLKYDGVPIVKNTLMNDDELEEAFKTAKLKSR